MARPTKTGLDYFPMDVNTDEKFELIEAKHELVGFAIVIKLFQKIYKEGYFLCWNEEKLLLFKKSVNVDINKINDVINDCFTYNIFNKELYDKYKILTSSGIQKRFLSACDRRKTVDLVKNYVIVDINSINVTITWVNDCNGTQSKVKESKVEESMEIPDWRKNFKNYNEALIYPFESDLFSAAWDLWYKFRSEYHYKKYKPTGEQAALTELKNLSDNNEEIAIKIINQSIAKNWQGLFALNDSHKPKPKQDNNPTVMSGDITKMYGGK
jgi:hypothetical protein